MQLKQSISGAQWGTMNLHGQTGISSQRVYVRWAVLRSCLVEKRKARYLKIRPGTNVEAGRKAIRMAGTFEGAAEDLDHHMFVIGFNLVPEGIPTLL